MQQSTPVSAVGSDSVAGQLPSNEAFRNVQQEYLEQWHLLENLQSDLASDAQSDGRQDSAASLQNSMISNANIQDTESNGYQQEMESNDKWFVLGEDPVGVSPDVPSEDEEITAKGNNAFDTDVEREQEAAKQNVFTQQLSPYSEQWYELEQLKASVRSLSHAAGLPQSPQPPHDDSETLASGLSSGSLSTEALDEVGLEGTSAVSQGEPIQAGSVMMGVAHEADDMVEQLQEDDPGDSGTSFSMDGSGADDQELRSQWFPLRPSAVGEDDEDTSQVAYTLTAAAHHSSSDRLQSVPHAWSDDDAKQTPPERSQPDGRDGPDLKRTPYMSTYTSRQQTVAPSAQNLPLVSGRPGSKDSGSDTSLLSQPRNGNDDVTPPVQNLPFVNGRAGSKDSGSDTSLLSQPQNGNGYVTPPVQNLPLVSGMAGNKGSGSDTSLLSQPLNDNGNVTPLDIISRSVPSVPKGTSLISELRHRHAPQLNSDSDTESPVSKLLGPNFRAVQQVLDRLKQDRLTANVSDDADDRASEHQSLREESLQSLTSTSRGHEAEWRAVQPGLGIKTRPSPEAVTSYEMLSSRPSGLRHLSHEEMPQENNHSRGESHRSLSLNAIDTSRKAWEPPRASSWTSARISYLDPSETTPQLVIPATIKPSQDHSSSSITSVRIAGEEYRPSSGHSGERLSQRDSSQTAPPPLLRSPYKYSTEQHPRSSIELSLRSSRIAWGEHTASGTNLKELLHHKDSSANAPSAHASRERLLEPSPRSSLGSSSPFRTAWAESTQIPTSPIARELSTGVPNEKLSSVIPADNLMFPGHSSSSLIDGAKIAPIADATLSSVGEKSHVLDRTGRGHKQPLPRGMDSDRSASSDDTDDLLTYEPVFEGDRQYLRKQRRAKHSGSKKRHSDAMELHENRLPARATRDIETGARMPGQEQPSSMMQGQEGIQGTPVDLNDSQIKALHWSLGAGTISPISSVSVAGLDSQLGKSSTPLGPASERSSVHEAGVLQEQSLEEDNTTAQSEDRVGAALKQTESHSTTEISSSDETYRPVLYGDVTGNKENRPDESVFKTASYGIYDVRRSSGPGSTNRRRKALGLQPNPTREAVSQEANGLVYISGSSTPSSVQDVRGRYLAREDHPTGKPASYREAQPDQQYYERIPERGEELRKPRTNDYKQEKQANVSGARQAREGHGKRDFQDPYQNEYLPHEDKRSDRSHRRQTHVPSSKGAPEPERGHSHHSLDRSRQPSVHYMDKTDPNRGSHSLGRGKRSASSGKSKSRYVEDDLALSQNARLEKAPGSRKHHLESSAAKHGHSSRDKSDFRGSKSSRLDDNISKLSSLISRSLDESLSSSSQTSTTASRRPTSKGKKAKMSSSTSETSDVSEFFNYVFFEPRFRQSIGEKMRLRELLRSVKSRDINPIVRRTRDSTSPESTSTASSNDGGRAERDPPPRVDREPPPALTEPRRSEPGTERPYFTSKPPAAEPKCTCSRKVVTQATSPGINRYSREGDDDRALRIPPRKRDVGVNFPTPVVTRRQSSSSDEAPRAKMEDASTQTDEVTSARKVHRKIDTEPEKLPPKPMKSKRNFEEHGVISQPSPQKSDYQYVVEQRDKCKPKERFIASQNSPDHSAKTSTDWRNRTQEPAWFYPLTSKPHPEQRSTTQLNTPSKSRTRDELRVDAFDSLVNSSSSLQKLTLQEAFLYARPQFVKRSQDRVARIEQAAREKERRKMIAEATKEENRKEAAESKTKTPPSTPKTKNRVKSDQVFMPKPRQMTRGEMKELNKRLYKNLPEVKAKNEEKKRLAFYRTNRLRAQLYDKRVRNRLKGAGK